MTSTPQKIFSQLGLEKEEQQKWESLHTIDGIPAGTIVQKGKPIFPRLDNEVEVQAIKDMMAPPAPKKEETKEEPKEQEIAPEVTIDDFLKLDFRVGEVIEAEQVKKADKLLKLRVDLGYEKRQVVSGIAEHYKPGELVGKKVIVVSNLKPVKLRGELSQGMILAGEDDEGILSLATIDQTLPNGTQIN